MSFFTRIFSLDLRSLALFRVGLALVLLGDLLVRADDLVAHYTDFGVLPRDILIGKFGNAWNLSLHFMGGTAGIQALLFLLAAVFGILLLLGYRTRLVTVLSWILLISVQARNPMILQGGDILLRMLMFWAMFLPLGAYYSIDSALNTSEEKKPTWYCSVATLALYVQFLLLYWCAAAYKTGAEWWAEGTAVYYALNIDHHATAFGHYLLEVAPLLLLKAMTYVTLAIEVIAPFLLIITTVTGRLRLLVLALFVGLHIGFASSLQLGIFPWISCVFLLAFIPRWFWDTCLSHYSSKQRAGLQIFYDSECGFCKKIVHLIRTFLLLSHVELQPAQNSASVEKAMRRNNSWVVVDHDGNSHFRWDGIITVCRASPLFWPLAYPFSLRFVKRMGNAAYDWVANHRPRVAVFTRYFEFRPLSIQTTILGQLMAGFFLVYIVLWNLTDLGRGPLALPPNLTWIGHTVRVDQMWNMFSPFPIKDDGWFVIPGKLADGSEIDLFTGNVPPTYAKPALISDMYANYHWDKYLRNLSSIENEPHRLYYGRYLCRDWNSRHSGDKALLTFQLIFMQEDTKPDYQPLTVEKKVLWDHSCF